MIDRLHYISQAAADGSQLTAVHSALSAGCTWIQLRIKDQPAADVLAVAIEANRLCKAFGARLIINDYPEIALRSGADGVHLGLGDQPVSEARALAGPACIIGGTANTWAHVLQRVAEGVDYIGLGPYRFTATKKNLSPVLGIEGYRSIMRQARQAGVRIPVIAVGGIGPGDVPQLMQCGVHGVAVSSAITHAADARDLVGGLYCRLHQNSNPQFL